MRWARPEPAGLQRPVERRVPRRYWSRAGPRAARGSTGTRPTCTCPRRFLLMLSCFNVLAGPVKSRVLPWGSVDDDVGGTLRPRTVGRGRDHPPKVLERGHAVELHLELQGAVGRTDKPGGDPRVGCGQPRLKANVCIDGDRDTICMRTYGSCLRASKVSRESSPTTRMQASYLGPIPGGARLLPFSCPTLHQIASEREGNMTQPGGRAWAQNGPPEKTCCQSQLRPNIRNNYGQAVTIITELIVWHVISRTEAFAAAVRVRPAAGSRRAITFL